MSPACSALMVSSSLCRGPATSWASLRPLARTGAGGTLTAAAAVLVVVVAGAVAGALAVQPDRPSRNIPASTRDRFMLEDRSRPRRTTHAATTSSASWAMVVGHVGY